VTLEEELQHVAVGDPRGIEDDLDGRGVAGWWPYVGFSFSPPASPTRVEITPSRRRSSSWSPQKQPAARIRSRCCPS
jgi:hypothetical protein